MNHVRHQSALLRCWLVLSLLAFVQVAQAQGQASNVTQFATATITSPSNGSASGWFNTRGEACTASMNISLQWYTTNQAAWAPYTSGMVSTEPNCRHWLRDRAGNFLPPAGNTDYAYQTRTVNQALPCPSAGSVRVINVTAGYTTSANGSQDVLNLPSLVNRMGQTMCVASGGSTCTYTIGNPVDSWAATQPTATGLYRISDDWQMIATGASCTPTAAEVSQTEATATIPPCPGVQGTVNGRPVCVPTSGTPTAKPASGGANRAGNPSSGSDGSQSLPQRTPATSGNNGNGGSVVTSIDGTRLGARDTGIPATAGTSAATGGGGSSLDPALIKTDCDKYPNTIGCKEFGTPDNSVTLARQDSGFSTIGVVGFGTVAGCPAPMTFDLLGTVYTISYTPICNNAADYIRPVVLVLAAALAAFVFVGGFRS